MGSIDSAGGQQPLPEATRSLNGRRRPGALTAIQGVPV